MKKMIFILIVLYSCKSNVVDNSTTHNKGFGSDLREDTIRDEEGFEMSLEEAYTIIAEEFADSLNNGIIPRSLYSPSFGEKYFSCYIGRHPFSMRKLIIDRVNNESVLERISINPKFSIVPKKYNANCPDKNDLNLQRSMADLVGERLIFLNY